MSQDDRPYILVVTSSYPRRSGDPSGVFIHGLNRELAQHYRVVVLAPWEKGLLFEEDFDGVTIVRHRQFLFNVQLAYGSGILPSLQRNPLLAFAVPFFILFQFLSIHRLIRRHRISVVHAHWLIPSALTAVAYKSLLNRRIRIIATLLGADVWSFNKGWKQYLAKFALRHIDTVTAQSPPLLDEVKRMGHKGRGMVLPIGIDTSRFSPEQFSPELRQRYGNNGPMLLFVGSLIDRKGVVPLVEAAGMLRAKGFEFTLLMVGSGDREAYLRQLIAEKGLDNHVILAGRIPNSELPPYFATADIFVLPSLSEGFPLVVMEALSSGTLPVVSDLSVFLEHPERDELFCMARVGDALHLAGKLEEVLSDPQALDEKKTELREYATANMDIKRIAEQYYGLIDELRRPR
jgi:glycosyltransferase involved in cell wall biosynthesis